MGWGRRLGGCEGVGRKVEGPLVDRPVRKERFEEEKIKSVVL